MVEKSEKLILVPSELVIQLTQELFGATIVVCPVGIAVIPLKTRDRLLRSLLKITKENGLTPIRDIMNKEGNDERNHNIEDS